MAVAVLVLGSWFLATGPLLGISSVEVRGYERDDAAQLGAALETAASGGTAIRPPIADIRRAARRFPWVADVRVSRELPRGVVVRVIPSEPFAVVRSPGHPPMLVDVDGRVLDRAPSGSGLPVIRLTRVAPDPGERLPRASAAALTFLAAADADVAGRVRGLGVRGGQLQAALVDGPKLRLGAPERLAAKAAALQVVLNQLGPDEERAATYIDLSVPERPAVGGLVAALPDDSSVG